MQQRLLTAIRTVAISLCVLAAGIAPATAQYDDRYDDRYEDRYDDDRYDERYQDDYRYEGEYDDPPERVARISLTDNEVSFSPAGESEWYRAHVNRPLVRGDHLYTGNGGLAEFQFGDAAVRIDEYSAVQILGLDDGYAQIELAEGTLNLFVRHLYRNEVVEIATPMLALVVSEPGSYRIDVDPDNGQTDVLVWDGAAEAWGTRANFPLRRGDAVRFYDADLRDYEIYRLPRPDRFDRFAMERDDRMRRSESRAYLPEGVIGYEDLDRYGRWDNVRDYGRVWYPRDVARDWAPYRNGHWIWQEPWGWTWVDAAPWGFAPFHYGRWAQINNRWGWVPGPRQVRAVYAPALVAFVGGRNFSVGISLGSSSPVGWFPLGPREVYVPPYYASRDYFRRVNVSNTVINTTTITNVYNNYYVQDGRQRQSGLTQLDYRYRARPEAMTVVSSDAFVGGRSVREARIAIDQRNTAAAEVHRFAAVAPQQTSLVGGVSRASNVRPSRAILQRQVVARRAVEPAVVPFAARVEQLKRNQGRPLARQQVERIRAQRGSAQAQAEREVRVVGERAQRVERPKAAAAATVRELPRGQVTRGSRPPAVQRGIEQRRAREADAAQRDGDAPARQQATPPSGDRDDGARGRAQQQGQERAEQERAQRERGRADSERSDRERAERAAAERDAAERSQARGRQQHEQAEERARDERAAQARERDDAERGRALQAQQQERARAERARAETERKAEQAREQQRIRQAAQAREAQARQAAQAREAQAARQAAQAREAQAERKAEQAREAQARQAAQAREAQAARQAAQAREAQAERQAEQAREAQARQAEQAREAQAARQAAQAREAQAERQAQQAREQQARQAEQAREAQAERGRAEQQARQAAAARGRGQRTEPAPAVQGDEPKPERGRGRGRNADDDEDEDEKKDKERGRR